MLTNPSADSTQSKSDSLLQSELEFLYDRINYERTTDAAYPKHFKLQSMRRLLAELGDPQNDYSIVHVAGTKGKGSVCKMIAGALNHSGIVTGVYSSPHIESIHERISVNGQLISSEELAGVLADCRQAVERLDLIADEKEIRKNSFFEIITAAALLHFSRVKAERVVLEVGLGGRLDSTNVCEPELCVITNISLDHTRQLGSTVDRIAREKAGIIKRHIPIVSGAVDPVAAKEIRETSSVCDAPLLEADRDFTSTIDDVNDSEIQITFSTKGELIDGSSYHLDKVVLNSAGRHQVENAAIAVSALKQLQKSDSQITDQAIRQSMLSFGLIGRGEVLSKEPLILVDMAHNVASVEALSRTITRMKQGRKFNLSTLVFASSQDKDLRGMLTRLLPLFDRIILTRFIENPRATDPADLLKIAHSVADDLNLENVRSKISVQANPKSTWEHLRVHEFSSSNLANQLPLLCVAGSAFLVAEIRPLISEWLESV